MINADYAQGYAKALLDARRAIADAVPLNWELNQNGTEDKLRSAFVEGVHTAYDAVGELL